MPPPRPFLQIMVSPYSSRRSDFVERKARADRLTEDGHLQQARDEYATITREGLRFLRDRLGSSIAWPEGMGHVCIGMFAGDSEPSSALPFHFESDAEMMERATTLKRVLIEFGEHFFQHNVHLLAFGTTEPQLQVGEQQDDWTCQELHRVVFREILPNHLLRLQNARDCGIHHLTITQTNEQAMIYSIGRPDSSFRECVRCFQEMAGDDASIHTLTERVLLWNVGNREYGATHSYAQWRSAYGADERPLGANETPTG